MAVPLWYSTTDEPDAHKKSTSDIRTNAIPRRLGFSSDVMFIEMRP